MDQICNYNFLITRTVGAPKVLLDEDNHIHHKNIKFIIKCQACILNKVNKNGEKIMEKKTVSPLKLTDFESPNIKISPSICKTQTFKLK